MTESQASSILGKSLKNIGWYYAKIPDFPFRGNGQRFLPERPYDSFAFSDEYSFAFEAKIIKSKAKSPYTSFRFKDIKPHQLDNLQDANERKRTVGILVLYVWRAYEVNEVNFIPISMVIDALENSIERFSKEFIQTWEYKYNCYNDLFALPIDLDKKLFAIKNYVVDKHE